MSQKIKKDFHPKLETLIWSCQATQEHRVMVQRGSAISLFSKWLNLCSSSRKQVTHSRCGKCSSPRVAVRTCDFLSDLILRYWVAAIIQQPLTQEPAFTLLFSCLILLPLSVSSCDSFFLLLSSPASRRTVWPVIQPNEHSVWSPSERLYKHTHTFCICILFCVFIIR